MTTGIISLLVIVLPVAVALFWRWLGKRDASKQNVQHENDNVKIAGGNADHVTVGLNGLHDDLERLRHDAKGGGGAGGS